MDKCIHCGKHGQVLCDNCERIFKDKGLVYLFPLGSEDCKKLSSLCARQTAAPRAEEGEGSAHDLADTPRRIQSTLTTDSGNTSAGPSAPDTSSRTFARSSGGRAESRAAESDTHRPSRSGNAAKASRKKGLLLAFAGVAVVLGIGLYSNRDSNRAPIPAKENSDLPAAFTKVENDSTFWEENRTATTISAGSASPIALREDGTVIFDYPARQIPGWPTDVTAISASGSHSLALQPDGTVAALGSNLHGECEVTGWTDIAAVSAGGCFSVGLKKDGTVVATEYTGDQEFYYGQCDVSEWTDMVAVSAGTTHTVGLRSDGTVVATAFTGEYYSDQCDVSDWTDIVAVSAGTTHTVGLRSDGTVVAVGSNFHGECEVTGWTDIVAISAGSDHTVGLRADGTVVATMYTGDEEFYYGQCDVSEWKNVIAVSAGYDFTMGLRADGSVVVTKSTLHDRDVSSWTNILVPGIVSE